MKLRRRFPNFVDGPRVPEEYVVNSIEELNEVEFIKHIWLKDPKFKYFAYNNDLLIAVMDDGRMYNWCIAWALEGSWADLGLPKFTRKDE